MISADAGWKELDAQLRAFVARRVGSAVDVEDVVQDVLLKVHRGLSTLRDEERFGPWVYQIARRAIADHLRAKARHPIAAGEPEELAGEEEDRAVEQALVPAIAAFVAALPSPYREALVCTELAGKSQVEVAAELGVSRSAMRSRVQRGRAQLRAALEECCRIALDARGGILSCEPREERDCC